MKNRYIYLLLSVLCLTISACGGTKVVPQTTAEKYFQEGEMFMEKGLYQDAITSWEKVRDTYYSPELNMLAELKIAEAYYRSERYTEAATAYLDYLKQHPSDQRTDEVLYRLGLSYYQQILSADRDQSAARKALETFRELLRRFPDYPLAAEANVLIQRCQIRLAEHELYVGHFYLQQEQYQAAIKRLQSTLENYPDFYARDEVLFYLGTAFLESGQKEHARAVLEQLIENYPGSEYAIDAQDQLSEMDK